MFVNGNFNLIDFDIFNFYNISYDKNVISFNRNRKVSQ